MSRLDRIRALGTNASQRIEAVTRDPQQALQQAQASARDMLSGAVTPNSPAKAEMRDDPMPSTSQTRPSPDLVSADKGSAGVDSGQLAASERPQASRAKGLHRSAASLTEIERLLQAVIPDWSALLATVEQVRIRNAPLATVAWTETQSLSSRGGLRKGGDHDMWTATGVIGLYRHPGWQDRLFGWLVAILAKLFAPLLNLRRRFDGFIAALSARLGAALFFLGLPLALLGFIVDTMGLLGGLLRNLPSLLLSPIQLLREIVAIPFRLLAALLSRIICTFLLAWLGPLLASSVKIEALLRRYPWLRGVILGFLRSDRPLSPTLIPTACVSQVLRVRRRGLTGTKEYVVVVEGRPITKGFGAWLGLKFKQIVLPFYWERTVHMLCLPKSMSDDAKIAVCSAFGRQATDWS